MWGVYENENTDTIHIIPCDVDGEPFDPHEESIACPCHPGIIAVGEDGREIVNHNMIH